MARPKGSKNKKTVFLNNLLDEFKVKIVDPKDPTKKITFDWRRDLAEAIATQNVLKIGVYVELMPYLLSKIVPKEQNTISTPIESKQSAEAAFKLFEEMNGKSNPASSNKNVLGDGHP